jgi:hypothetical protein
LFPKPVTYFVGTLSQFKPFPLDARSKFAFMLLGHHPDCLSRLNDFQKEEIWKSKSIFWITFAWNPNSKNSPLLATSQSDTRVMAPRQAPSIIS